MLNVDELTGEIIKPNNDYVHGYKDEIGNICIDCDLPGRDKNSIHIYWYGSKNLAIIADECDTYDYYSRESVYVTFHFQNDMDYDNSTATYNNGVLTISTKPLSENNKNV